MNALRLIKIDFDNLENRNPEYEKTIGLFIGDDNSNAYSKAEYWFSKQKPEMRYVGWDKKVYPQYKLVQDIILNAD